jgi:hypothetical protein
MKRSQRAIALPTTSAKSVAMDTASGNNEGRPQGEPPELALGARRPTETDRGDPDVVADLIEHVTRQLVSTDSCPAVAAVSNRRFVRCRSAAIIEHWGRVPEEATVR